MPLIGHMGWIGFGSAFRSSLWIGLDWVIELVDWIGLDWIYKIWPTSNSGLRLRLKRKTAAA